MFASHPAVNPSAPPSPSLCTKQISPDKRIRTWVQSLGHSVGLIPVQDFDEPDGIWLTPDPSMRNLVGTIQNRPVGRLNVAKVAANRQSVSLRARKWPGSSPHALCVLQTKGASTFIHDRTSTTLSCGELAFIPVCDELKLVSDSAFECCIISFQEQHPWQHVAGRQSEGLRLDGRSPLQRLIFNLVERLAVEPLPRQAEYSATLADTVCSLLDCAFKEHGQDIEATDESGRVSRESIKHFIDLNLHDTELSADTVAKALGCSRRTVYRTFDGGDGDENLSRYMWRRRVERCAEVLRNGRDGSTLTQLAYSFGFSSSAHFSRLFKQHMGVAPLRFKQHQLSSGARGAMSM